MLRRNKWVDTNSDEFDPGGTEVGAGINLTSNLKFTENDIGAVTTLSPTCSLSNRKRDDGRRVSVGQAGNLL